MKKLILALMLVSIPSFFAQSAFVTFEISELDGSSFIDGDFEEITVSQTIFNITYEFSTQNLRNEISESVVFDGNSGEELGERISYDSYFPTEQSLQFTPFNFLFDNFLNTFARENEFINQTNQDTRDIVYSNTHYETLPQFVGTPEGDRFEGFDKSGFNFDYQDLRHDWTLENDNYVGQRVASSTSVEHFDTTSPVIEDFADTADLSSRIQSLASRDAVLSFSRQSSVRDFVSDDNFIGSGDFTSVRSLAIFGNAKIVDFDLSNNATSIQVSEPTLLGFLIVGMFGIFYTRRK